LVVYRGAVLRIPGGHRETGDALALIIRLDIAAVLILRLAVEPASHFLRRPAFGQDGHAVEALLPVPDGTIAGRLDVLDREAVVLRLDFLQASDVGLRFGQPFDKPGQPGADAVDVEGRDLQ